MDGEDLQHVACPNCTWEATTRESGPRGAALLRAALDDHLTREHPAQVLRGRDIAFVGQRGSQR